MTLDEFIASKHRNLEVKEPGLLYYVRKSIFCPGLIELANCAAPPKSKTFGFWRFMRRYEHRIPFIAEQVINEDMARWFERRGWRRYDEGWADFKIPQFASPLACEMYADTSYFQRRYPE